MNKLLIGLVLVALLSGCSWFKEKPRDVVIAVERIDTCSKPPKADKIIMRNVDFKIVKDEHGIFWIAVTPRFYENLSVNMKEITQHIKQKNAIVKYYESCHDEKVEEKPEDKKPTE